MVPDRSNITIALSPAVGILISNLFAGILVLGPPIVRALVVPATDEIDELVVEVSVHAMREKAKTKRNIVAAAD